MQKEAEAVAGASNNNVLTENNVFYKQQLDYDPNICD